MTTFTFSEARQKLSTVLDKAINEGEVLIKRKDGSVFVIKPFKKSTSPFNVKGVNIDISANEIVDYIREGRERF